MAGVTARRNSPFSPFSANLDAEILIPPFYRGEVFGGVSGGEVLAKACNPEYTTLGAA